MRESYCPSTNGVLKLGIFCNADSLNLEAGKSSNGMVDAIYVFWDGECFGRKKKRAKKGGGGDGKAERERGGEYKRGKSRPPLSFHSFSSSKTDGTANLFFFSFFFLCADLYPEHGTLTLTTPGVENNDPPTSYVPSIYQYVNSTHLVIQW
jgi:hypothetical protein